MPPTFHPPRAQIFVYIINAIRFVKKGTAKICGGGGAGGMAPMGESHQTLHCNVTLVRYNIKIHQEWVDVCLSRPSRRYGDMTSWQVEWAKVAKHYFSTKKLFWTKKHWFSISLFGMRTSTCQCESLD